VTLRFGTDGVRGDAETDLTSPLVQALGRAAARVLGIEQPFLLGRDTRESGPRIERDLAVGLLAEGAPVKTVGVLPTPGLAYVAATDGVPAAMISASHNPWRDNGVKLFAPGGRKLDDDTEAEIERVMHACLEKGSMLDAVAQVPRREGAHDDYVDHLIGTLNGRDLRGLSVVVDCANGAASTVAARVLVALGAEPVHVMNGAPETGREINEGSGSTHPEALQVEVMKRRADIGLACDGDADRVIGVDERGELVDGDQILVMAALDLRARGRLRNDAVAVTVMSNLGLRRALHAGGIKVVETPVGDRNVLVALDEHDLVLGGEQSGHIVFREHATTGDGLLTGLVLLDLVKRSGHPLSELARAMTRFPQVLVNVRVAQRGDVNAVPELTAAIRDAEARLGDSGRVLVRASGTEPVVRVMVEAPTHEVAEAEVDALVAAVHEALGAS
jgi:phosphoglucosamine mutase